MRVLVNLADSNDGCSWYRGFFPFGHLAKNHPISVKYDANPTWGTLRESDVLFVLRPVLPAQKTLIDKAKDLGVKVWIDYDDDLLAIESDNPSFDLYTDPANQERMKACMKAADILTVSTQYLGRKYGGIVVPNAFDPALLKHRPIPGPQRAILWRGTRTHDQDLDEVRPAICNLLEQRPDITWLFIGYNPWYFTKKYKNAVHLKGAYGVEYWKLLAAIRPMLSIAPLAEMEFNWAKSNIAALEAAFAGAPCVCRDWEEWKIPGAMNYGVSRSFEEAVVNGIEHAGANSGSESWDHFMANQNLDIVNKIRGDILWGLK